jgi:hypothetical protein
MKMLRAVKSKRASYNLMRNAIHPIVHYSIRRSQDPVRGVG